MIFFSKKEEENLSLIGTTQTVILTINDQNFEQEKPKVLHCSLKNPNLCKISGGSAPYKINSVYIENEIMQDESTEQGIAFSSNSFTEIRFSIRLSQLLEFFAKGKKEGIVRFVIQDSKYQQRNIEVKVNFESTWQRLKKSEAIYIENILFQMNEEKQAEIIFLPEIEIVSLYHDPKITIYFEDRLGIKRISLEPYYMGKEEKWGTFHFHTNKTKIEIMDTEALRKESKREARATIALQTKGNLVLKTILVDLTQVKRTLQKLKTEEKDWRNFQEKDLIAIHMTTRKDSKKLIDSKIFGPKVMYATAWRPSIHLTLNHVVVPHGAAPEGWKNADRAILMPFQELKKINEKTFYGGPTVDVSFFAYIKLPKGTIIVEREEGEIWETFVERINDKMREMEFRVMKGGEWGWDENASEVSNWLTKMSSEKNWPTTTPHFYTPIGKIENQINTEKFEGVLLRDMEPIKANKLFRKKLLERIELYEPNLWSKYGIHLKAWSNFWDHKLK